MDAVLLLPYAPRGTVVDGFVHSIPLTIHRSRVLSTVQNFACGRGYLRAADVSSFCTLADGVVVQMIHCTNNGVFCVMEQGATLSPLRPVQQGGLLLLRSAERSVFFRALHYREGGGQRPRRSVDPHLCHKEWQGACALRSYA